MRCCKTLLSNDKKGRVLRNRCPKKARQFFKVSYVENARVYRDTFYVFGFCDEHCESTDWTDRTNWDPIGRRSVYNVYSFVDSVERMDSAEAAVHHKNRTKDEIVNLLRKEMRLKKFSRVSPDLWRECFEEALNTHVLESVMKS